MILIILRWFALKIVHISIKFSIKLKKHRIGSILFNLYYLLAVFKPNENNLFFHSYHLTHSDTLPLLESTVDHHLYKLKFIRSQSRYLAPQSLRSLLVWLHKLLTRIYLRFQTTTWCDLSRSHQHQVINASPSQKLLKNTIAYLSKRKNHQIWRKTHSRSDHSLRKNIIHQSNPTAK